MKRKTKKRNPIALAGLMRKGAGRHKDRKKEADKKRCRGRVGT